jgi:Uma2 family endonuclease
VKAEEPIADYAKLDLGGTYSYLDYLRWQFKERVELIRGKVRQMSPAPNTNHQLILSNLGVRLANHFENNPCSVFFAPFDVRLPITKPGKDHTVVQPDICVICDGSKLDKQGAKDAPDLVVEILSPGNSDHEMHTKFELYEESGVREYWIVDPDKRVVLVYCLQEGKYTGLKPFVENDRIDCRLFPDLDIRVNHLFKNLR